MEGIGEWRIDPNRITPTRGGLYPSHEIGRGQRTYRQSLKAHWSVGGRGGPYPSVKSIRRTLGTVRAPPSSVRFNLLGEHSSKELSFSLDRSKLFERRILWRCRPTIAAVDLVHSDEVPKCLNVSKLLLVNCLNCLKLFGSYRKIRSLIVWQVLSGFLNWKLNFLI